MPGIMFRLRWKTIQSEPASVMTRKTMVKMVESSSQPSSALGVMCRKKTMCTRICAKAQTSTMAAV